MSDNEDLDDIFADIGDDDFSDVDSGIVEVPGTSSGSFKAISQDPSTHALQFILRLLTVSSHKAGLNVTDVALFSMVNEMTDGLLAKRVDRNILEVRFYWAYHFHWAIRAVVERWPENHPETTPLRLAAFNNLKFILNYATYAMEVLETAYIERCRECDMEPQVEAIKQGLIKTDDPFTYQYSTFSNLVMDTAPANT